MRAQVYTDIMQRFNNPKTIVEYTKWINEYPDWLNEVRNWNNIKVVSVINAPLFKNVAIYNSQVQRCINGTLALDLSPACFIEIEDTNSGEILEGGTVSDMLVKFHIVLMELDGGNGALDQNLNIFILRNYVKKLFSLFKVNNGGPFVWANEDEEYIHSNVYHYIMAYKFHYVDWVGRREYLEYTLSGIKLELNLNL